MSRAEERVSRLEILRLPRRIFANGFGGFRPVMGGMPSGYGSGFAGTPLGAPCSATTLALTDTTTRIDTLLPLPGNTLPAGDTYLMVEIRSRYDAFPAWNQPLRVYLRPTWGTFAVVGIER